MCNADGKDISIPIIGTFLFVPYVIFSVVFFILRRLIKQVEPPQESETVEIQGN